MIADIALAALAPHDIHRDVAEMYARALAERRVRALVGPDGRPLQYVLGGWRVGDTIRVRPPARYRGLRGFIRRLMGTRGHGSGGGTR